MEPLLKWVGGKRWQVPAIKRLWYGQRYKDTTERRFVEPFCGGLSVSLALEPVHVLVNDANPHLINFYRQVAKGLTIDLELTVGDYYNNRTRFNDLIRHGMAETSEAAQLFWYLNKFGYNGLCRFNASGEFNSPEGRQTSDVKVFSREIARITLGRLEFRCGDFADVPIGPDDFIYADPPYDDGFTTYTGDAFTWEDQERVAMLYASHSGPVILTNLATPRIDTLYRSLGYRVTYISAPRRVGKSRKRVDEILATNFPVNLIGLPVETRDTLVAL